MSTFSGLNVGLSSLYAQRRGLEVTGQNIANVNTDGYSRQRLRLSGDGGPVTPALHARWSGAGNGVTVDGVDRLRDAFLEARSLAEHGTDSALRARRGVLADIEAAIGEPGDIGVQAQLSDFFNGWDDVANHPDVLAARTQLLERARTLATGLNTAAGSLGTLWQNAHQQLGVIAEQVNATAARVAELNRSIASATAAGLSPNDLADQRDVLVGQLADLVGATARPGEDGTVNVFVGGTALVRGVRNEQLRVGGGTGVDAAQPDVQLEWVQDSEPDKPGYPAVVTGGQAGGLLTALNDVLPRYLGHLDEVAARLADTVNQQHVKGVDLNGADGKALFVAKAGGPVTAATIGVGLAGPAELAAAAKGAGPRDGGNAGDLAELAGKPDGAGVLYRAMVVGLGVETDTANRRVDIQTEMTRQVDAARDAVAGVNLDEEMSNMLMYQRAYEAAGRFVSSIDQMLDTLINRTGVVGR